MGQVRTHRQPTLRQVEVLKAVVELGSVTRAAEALCMSQPAASKLLSNLEADIGLELFSRRRGLLVPNERGLRFYAEVDRVFAGLDQLGRAVDDLRREERGQLTIGVLPGLSGPFICSVIETFRASNPEVYISLQTRSSQYLVEWMRSGQLDLCLVTARFEDAHIEIEPLLKLPMVCILPVDHPLTAKSVLSLKDIAEAGCISFRQGSHSRLKMDRLFESHGLRPNVVMEADIALNVCELVARGMGIALVHPIFARNVQDRVAVRLFELADPIDDFLMCRPRHGRNRHLVSSFAQTVRETAETLSRDALTRLADLSAR